MANDLNSSSENSDQNSPKRRRLLRKRQSNTRLNYNENDFGLFSDVESDDFQNSAERSDETWLPNQSDFDHAELTKNASRNSTMNNDNDQREITNSNENGMDSCGKSQLLCTISTTVNAGDGVVSGPSNVQANGNKSKFKVLFQTSTKQIIKRVFQRCRVYCCGNERFIQTWTVNAW